MRFKIKYSQIIRTGAKVCCFIEFIEVTAFFFAAETT